MLVSFAQDMFPAVSTDDIGVRPADDGELVVSVRWRTSGIELKGRTYRKGRRFSRSALFNDSGCIHWYRPIVRRCCRSRIAKLAGSPDEVKVSEGDRVMAIEPSPSRTSYPFGGLT